MGTPSGMAAMGMNGKQSSMAMPTPSSSQSGVWGSTSATTSPSSSPVYTGAAQTISRSNAGIVGVGLTAAAVVLLSW